MISAIALGINLYVLHFNQPDEIKRHTDAANELWEVREKYKSLIVDFESIEISEARGRRDALMMEVSKVNKDYPGTDEKSFNKARANMDKYKFEDGEAAKLLHTEC